MLFKINLKNKHLFILELSTFYIFYYTCPYSMLFCISRSRMPRIWQGSYSPVRTLLPRFWSNKCSLICNEIINEGHDPNPLFSGITFFSGLSLWSLQIKKRSLMGCLFFDADFLTFFHFGR